MEAKQIFPDVYMIEGRLATRNLVPGKSVYGEELTTIDKVEYRGWNPYRSKLGAAIMNKMRTMRICKGASVLYLGAATGTTCSHVSDIIGEDGSLYCIELSERNLRELLKVCETRPNMLPVLEDARNVDKYAGDVGEVDVIYQDVSARDQAEILLANSKLLKDKGYAYVAIKSQSISVAKKPELVYKEFLETVGKGFNVIEKIDIMPYDKMHMFVVLEKK